MYVTFTVVGDDGQFWGNFPLEDLSRLRKWLENNLPTLESKSC